jgi:hypothetical protein
MGEVPVGVGTIGHRVVIRATLIIVQFGELGARAQPS